MSRQKQRVNYREITPSPTPQTLSNDEPYTPSKAYITYFGICYESGQRPIFVDEYQFNILALHQYDFNMAQKPRIVGVLNTKNGLTSERGIVLKCECPFEFWISSIKGKEEKLKMMEWTNDTEIFQYKLPKSFRLKYKNGDIAWYSNIVYCNHNNICNCNLIPRWVKVRIIRAVRPKYMGELCPMYYVYCWNRKIVSKFWAQESSLYDTKPSENHPYEDLRDILLWWILKCPQYKQYCMLGGDIPLYVDIESGYYRKKEIYLNDETLIKLSSTYNKLFEREYQSEIEYLLNKTFGQTVNIKNGKNVKIRASKQNLMKYAILITPYKFDFYFKTFLLSKKTLFIYNKTDIIITINMPELQNLRNNDKIIYKFDDGSSVEIASEITLKYIRESSELYVKSFGYVCKNRYIVVEEENDNELNVEEILQQIDDNDLF